CRANANKVAARVLLPLLRDLGVKLVDFEGGNMRNAIPREAFATILVPVAAEADVMAKIEEIAATVKKEYAVTDPEAAVFIEDADAVKVYISDEDALKGVYAVLACPDGVERMSDQMPGLVETSNNLAIVKTEGGRFYVKSLLRSSVDTAKDLLAEKMAAVFALAGGSVVFDGAYSGWAPNSASPILHAMKKVYTDLYGKEPAVMAIHAGLECGIFSGAYPDWDMVSCGPTIMSPHSPDERVNIASVEKCWDFIKAVLENIPGK
ncbi:MAG: M20/M25/M40 family metallo-hydrolase, partial [Bacteroidales bacterium]|nr:M20/M25/M40 family metallo-hydrolase [Bacteroidales bacterium]